MSSEPIKVRFKVEGIAELKAALDELSTRLSRKIQLEALRESAEPLRARMAELAPRSRAASPVHLAESMVISTSRGQDGQEVAVAVGPAKDAFWGGLQEFGTVHAPAQAFARPAFDSEVSECLDVLVEVLWRELKGIAKTLDVPAMPTSPGGGGLV